MHKDSFFVWRENVPLVFVQARARTMLLRPRRQGPPTPMHGEN